MTPPKDIWNVTGAQIYLSCEVIGIPTPVLIWNKVRTLLGAPETQQTWGSWNCLVSIMAIADPSLEMSVMSSPICAVLSAHKHLALLNLFLNSSWSRGRTRCVFLVVAPGIWSTQAMSLDLLSPCWQLWLSGGQTRLTHIRNGNRVGQLSLVASGVLILAVCW